jgi:ATP-dependent Clp protease ATP-binding subunit ClpA
MFERFTAEARRIVELGVDVATGLGHDYVGAEHLLIALAGTRPNIATRSLIASGFDPMRARDDLERIAGPRRDELGEADAAALRAIGVDLDEVRRRTEAAFGPGALDRRPRWSGRRRARFCGLPFMPKAKQGLELALREAVRFGHRSIGPEHVLLGLLRLDAVSTQLLEAQGVDLGRLRAEVIRSFRDLGQRGA